MEFKARRILISSLVGVTIGILGGTAHGSNVKSTYDPDTFFGDGLFHVDASCFAAANWGTFVTNDSGADDAVGCTVGLLSDTTTVTIPTLTHIDFTPFSPPDNFGVMNIHLSDTGVLDGVNSFIFSGTAIDGLGGSWGLEWVSQQIGDTHQVVNVVNLYQDTCNDACFQFFDVAPTVSFAPEPGSMALLLGGLGAGWIARRRRQTA